MARLEAVIFCGIQGSGKSSFYRERFVDTHLRLNLDMLRTRHRERLLLEAMIRAKQSFVVDNTNPTARERARYIRPAREAGFDVIGYYFDSTLEQALERNRRRPEKQRIPDRGVRAAWNRLEAPRRAEGFDAIHRVCLTDEGFVVEQCNEPDSDNAAEPAARS